MMVLRVMAILTMFVGCALAAGSGTTGNTATLSDAVDLVESGDYEEALDLLEDLNRRESGNPGYPQHAGLCISPARHV